MPKKKIQNTKNSFSGLSNPGSTKSSIACDSHLLIVINEDYLFLTPIPIADEAIRRWYSLRGRLGPPSELILFVIEAKIFFNLEKVSGKCSCFFTALRRRKWCWVLLSWKRKLSAGLILWRLFWLLSIGYYTPLDNRVNQARFLIHQEA